MSHATHGPPLGDEDDRADASDAFLNDAAVLPSDGDAPPGDKDRSSTVDRTELRAYLGLPTTERRIFSLVAVFVGPKMPPSTMNEIRQEACIAALTARSLPRSAQTMPGWLTTVTRRAVVHHFRRGARDKTWLNREADADEQPGEAPDPTDDARLVSRWLAAGPKASQRARALAIRASNTKEGTDHERDRQDFPGNRGSRRHRRRRRVLRKAARQSG